MSVGLSGRYFKAREVDWILFNPDVELPGHLEVTSNLYLLLPAASNNLAVT
jgi:hypothetical protein